MVPYIKAQKLDYLDRIFVVHLFLRDSATNYSCQLVLDESGRVKRTVSFGYYWCFLRKCYQDKFFKSEKNNKLRKMRMISLFMDYAESFSTLRREVGISDELERDLVEEGPRSWLNTKIEGFVEKNFDGLVKHARLLF
jgi:hypothetical protein